jgi:Fic family protein
MVEITGLRLTASAAVKEKRLAALLAGRDEREPALADALAAAEARGSLDLTGRGAAAGDEEALRRAIGAVDPRSPLTVEAILTWRESLAGDRRLRRDPRSRTDGPPPAPPEFIASRLAIVQDWLGGDSARELAPAPQGALAYARIMEILPFESGNGIVARLAAAHLMRRGGARRPVLVASDASRLEDALRSAFRLETGPLARVLEEGAERALDVLIATLS